MSAPELSELAALAERAVALLGCEGQAGILWERRLTADGDAARLTVAFTCVVEGRCARVDAAGTDERSLARAAKAATLRAGQARAWPSGGLPSPGALAEPDAPTPVSGAFDPALLTLAPSEVAAHLGPAAGWHAAATRTAVASTSGIRAAEERSYVAAAGHATTHLLLRGQTPTVTNQPILSERGPSPIASDRRSLRDSRRFAGFVLGPVAVAALLDRLRPALGVDLALGHGSLAGRAGQRVAAELVDLRDDARHRGTLPRAFDAEGVPRRPVALLERGVLHGGVLDSAAAARLGRRTTGHATQAGTLAPMPDHLVLAGGEADTIEELLGAGAVYVPELTEEVELDPLAVLASVEALTRDRQTVPLRSYTPGGSGAAVVPALRATAGVTLRA